MEETSPGDDDGHYEEKTAITASSFNDQFISLPIKEHHFDCTIDHPPAETFQCFNCLHFRAISSQDNCLSLTYGSPVINPTTLDWKVCCEPDEDVGGEYVTYHKLTDVDDSLSAVMAKYAKPNIVGLILINSTNSRTLSYGFINKTLSMPPVYIISSKDGEKLTTFINKYEGVVKIKVYVETPVDTQSLFPSQSSWCTKNESDFQNNGDVSSPYNLLELLKKNLLDNKERIHVCADPAKFQCLISCFHNFEASQQKKSLEKPIKLLHDFTEESFKKDFLVYFLIAYRFIKYHNIYYDCNSLVHCNNFIHDCIEKFEAWNDVQAIANVIFTFIKSEDFLVQFNHDRSKNMSVFKLLYFAASAMLKKSIKIQAKKNLKINIYSRILWIALTILFGLQVKIDQYKLWETELLDDKLQKEITFTDNLVKDFRKGFELLNALKLSDAEHFSPTVLAMFLDPLKLRQLHISHITELLEAVNDYLNWDFISLCHFLMLLKSEYDALFCTFKVNWSNYSKDGTKIGFYKEAMKFLEYIYNWISKISKTDKTVEEAKKNIVETWIKLLIDNVDMIATDAIDYIKVFWSQKNCLAKHSSFITAEICKNGIKIVKRLPMEQFSNLFVNSLFWTFQFVEAFLNNYAIPDSIDLKDASLKFLFEEIISRFPDAKCKKCIVDFIRHTSEAYKRAEKQEIFIVDLIKMKIPNLLFVKANEDGETNIGQLFIDRVCTFLQEFPLYEVLLKHIPTIMKLFIPDNHLHSLILKVLQKIAVLDSEMLKKVDVIDFLISESVKVAINSFDNLLKLTEVQKYYWHLIASCCSHVQPNDDYLIAHVHPDKGYLLTIEMLGKIFQNYCIQRKLEKSLITEVPQEINDASSKNVKDYFKWIINIQKILIDCRSKFESGNYSYDDIFVYADQIKTINAYSEAVCAENLALSDDKIVQLKAEFSSIYAKLCLLLVKNIKGKNWCTLEDMLKCYSVNFCDTILTKLNRYLVLPEEAPVVLRDNVQQMINQPSNQFELEPEMILRLKKSVTFNILKDLLKDLLLYLKPVATHMKFLVYFHLHKCELFSKYLKMQMRKMLEKTEESFVIPTTSVYTTQSSTNQSDKLSLFATALPITKEFILCLMKGNAKYGEIFTEGFLQEDSMQSLDIANEFQIMRAFSEFQKNSDAYLEGEQGVKYMFELFQYTKQILVIHEVCSQYGLYQCLKDTNLKKLEKMINKIESAEDKAQVTGKIAIKLMKEILELLNFDDPYIGKKCLKIFPAVANCAEFYKFIQSKNFANDTSAFRSQVELITSQLQHEDYNETILNHLMPAFQYICPFLNKTQSFRDLMHKIIKLYHDGVGFGCDSRNDFCQLETVNSNIIMIQLWFSRTEGDTQENVSTDLYCIMNSGHFELLIKQKQVICTSEVDFERNAKHKSQVLLHHNATMKSYLQKRQSQSLSVSQDKSLPTPSSKNREMSETWNNEQIDDFVRKLGFLQPENSSVEDEVKLFQQLNQTAQKLFQALLKLRDLGHPNYLEKEEEIICSDGLESAQEKVDEAEKLLNSWTITVENMYISYDNLLFFSFSKVLSLYTILTAQIFSADEMIQEVGFLFDNDSKAIRELQIVVKDSFGSLWNPPLFSNEVPASMVGEFLKNLCGKNKSFTVIKNFLNGRNQSSALSKDNLLHLSQEVVHFAPYYHNGQLLRLLIKIYNGLPKPYEVFYCDENSDEEDLKLFLKRAFKFRCYTYTILRVNLLPYKLQEIILKLHSPKSEKSIKSGIHLHYIETARSIVHEMPWVKVEEHKENGPDLEWKDAQQIFTNSLNIKYDLVLVYGNAGYGKTHYIKEQLLGNQPSLTIAINESFSPLDAIIKLRSLPRNESCKLFFNFTIVPSIYDISAIGVKEDSSSIAQHGYNRSFDKQRLKTTENFTSDQQIKYGKFMNTLAWFFFRLLVFEYIEDSDTGIAFRLPGDQQWKIFVEVPSLLEVEQKDSTQQDVNQYLDWIYEKIPIFRLIGKSVLIKKESPYIIDSSVQLVCKYLHAYKHRKNIKHGINRRYIEKGPLVKFGDNPNLTDKECYSLLKEYMPPHVANNKVLQQLFIKYMERRCIFMENFPGFNYNEGYALPFDHTKIDEDRLKEMVKNNMLARQQGRYYSNTSQLGQLLVEIMIDEVSNFCKINSQDSWAKQAHQQLIYEVKDGSGSIQLLTLYPEQLNENMTKKFEALGIEIPNMKELNDRKKLDRYLSSALDVPLKDERLQDVDDANYVLTLDYTVKMLNIHERKECGIPVIIEGETGVGKTALINMLSKLWNHALINKWNTVKGRIVDVLYKKSLDTDKSDLQEALKCNITELKITDTVKEELIELTKMEHTSSGGNTIPFYQFINDYLLEMTRSEIILSLLDVNFEMKQAEHNDKLLDFGVSPISYLIKNMISISSAQATSNMLCSLLEGHLTATFHKLSIHAALSPKKVQEFLRPIVKLAKNLLKIHQEKLIKGMKRPPIVTVFFDEINTSSCMGFFKEIIVDKTFEGELLPTNMFLVAACNPHRGNSLTLLENKEKHKEEAWVRGSYYVQKLHPTMRFLMWDYGSLNHEQEAAYIQSKMLMVNKDLDIVQNIEFSEVVVKCQSLLRQFAHQQLIHYRVSNNEAAICAKSCVSQRDIQRVFTFYGWIFKAYNMLQSINTEDVYCISKHPVVGNNINRERIKQRALLVALGLVYYMRLDTEYRRKFVDELDKMHFEVNFLSAFTQEMDFYTNKLDIPDGIAKTEALKENLFATIICTVTRTPLIIVGAPGSSKTLSFNLTISNLKGPESKRKFFRNIEVFKSLDPQYYQCSRHTTSTEIEKVFHRAINRQHSHKSCFSTAIHCVVFMDEAGLPEESHESLKVLHFHLDQQEVAFVAITNHILDAAKTNRAVSLFRPTASQEDLKILAKGCLCANPENPPLELKKDLETIVKFCPAYYTIMKEARFENFFGLRDFIHFINYIRRNRGSNITFQLVLQSLERNFNGTKDFEHICSLFLEKEWVNFNGDLEQQKNMKRNVIEIFMNSLSDKPFDEVRYKLIIDLSEDESITQLLFMFGILKRKNTRTYMCSDFLGDGQLQKINTIAAIRHSVFAGHTIIMSQTDNIYESFYDLFNQNFRKIDDPNSGPRYFTNIAIGAHLKPSKVDQNFQCIVVVKESQVINTPAPFLNRFEKYLLSHNSFLNLVCDTLSPCLKIITNIVYEKVKSFFSLLCPSSFYGGNKETVCSLLLMILPRHEVIKRLEINCKNNQPVDHQIDQLVDHKIDHLVDQNVDDTSSSLNALKEFSSKRVLLLKSVAKCLHESGRFCYMESIVEELQHDANCIVSLLESTDLKFAKISKNLENYSISTISQWIADAMDLIYDGETTTSVKISRASDGACMVITMITQWLVRYMCKKLMQLMTPEAAILNRKCIPISYLETYLNYQAHFSLKELIKKQRNLLNQCGDDEIPNKLICYTRSTPCIYQLPSVYDGAKLLSSEQSVVDLICDKADNVFLCKVSSISSQASLKIQLDSFQASETKTVFILIFDMQNTSHVIVNHIRVMIEEIEHTKTETKKLFVLLLHFPAMMLNDPCYPSLFLCGWDHYYLDTISHTSKSTIVNIREWFKLSCIRSKDTSLSTTQSLYTLLKKPESIQVIASRILLLIPCSKEVTLDCLPDIDVKVKYLKKILIDKKVADVLCLKFKSYWKPLVMADYLEKAASFSKSRGSSLNLSDYVDSAYKSLFFNFVAYMICQLSKYHNLDMLLDDSCDEVTLNLFLKMLEAYPIPKLCEVKAYNNTWDCRAHTSDRLNFVPKFPFFMELSSHIHNMVEQSIVDINVTDDTLQEKENLDESNKEQLFTKMYKHIFDKMSILIKEEEKIGVEYMSALAIKETEADKIWLKYFNDFTQFFFPLSAISSDNLHNKLVQLSFADVLKNYNEMKIIAIHCQMYLNQLDLTKIAATLKPIAQLAELRTNDISLYPENPENSLVATFHPFKPTLGNSNVSKFVIKSLFKALVNVIYQNEGIDQNRLQKWLSSYRDMMSTTSLKVILATAELEEQIKAKYHLMEATSLILLSVCEITNTTIEFSYVFVSHLCEKCFDQDFKFKDDKSFNLEQIVSSLHELLQGPQFVSISQFFQHVTEGLFAHFFHDNSTAVYSKEDIKFFLSYVKEQNEWKENIMQHSENLISMSKLKLYLDRILRKGWGKSTINAEPLNFYKSEICICVGETILSNYTSNEYIPPYHHQHFTDNQHTLIHGYFYTVLEKLQTCEYTPAKLVKLITYTEEIIEKDTKAKGLIAMVEKQALMEALLQAIADNFDRNDRTKINFMLGISDQLNDLIKDKQHHEVLLMHLIRRHHGPQGVLNYLDDNYRFYWEPLDCLKQIKEQLKGSHHTIKCQFPCFVNRLNKHQKKVYKELSKHLCEIVDHSSTEEAKIFFNSIIKGNNKRSTIRMMIWLCVYYEFYCNKKQSPLLITFLKEIEESLGLFKEHHFILKCFLNPESMIKMEEAPNPQSHEDEALLNACKADPIWEFFNPTDDNEDPSDVGLRHALANLIAVVFGIPDRSTHLWYHMFSPGELEDSYLTGFMYDKVVKTGALMYDCGCKLNEDGHYGSSDYKSRDSLSLHSWYMLLWCNFGAFCIGLLTQPTAFEQIKGHILPEWMSIRSYCMSQLKEIWLHMRNNMSFGEEERLFFIINSMYQLFMHFQNSEFPYCCGKFNKLGALIDYENSWHKLVHEHSKTDLVKLENHFFDFVPDLKCSKILEQRYPLLATKNVYMKVLIDDIEKNNCTSAHLFALNLFTLEQKKLQASGTLLTDLLEFYKWIHIQLSHLVTYERAKEITIGQVIEKTSKRYSSEICNHLTTLFKRIERKFNEYLKMNGGVFNSVTCNKLPKPNGVRYITKDTPLINLVSFEDTNKNDWLYIVLMDAVDHHNNFLKRVYADAKSSNCHYKKYLPCNPPELHLTEVTSQNCAIVSEEFEEQFLKLLNSHRIYSGYEPTAFFDLCQLEQDVVKVYIAGKPLVVKSCIRTIFRFRNSPTETYLPRNNPGCATDLSAIAQELPDDYKLSIHEKTKKNLEFHFHKTSYQIFTEIINGLRTVMGHLIQDVFQKKDKELNIKLIDYLRRLFKQNHQEFAKIGIKNQSINDIQRELLGDIELNRLYKCLELFVGWLQNGMYDFSSLPFSVFKDLKYEDADTIMKTCAIYSNDKIEQLLIKLDDFEKILSHSENNVITKEEFESSSIMQCLIDLKLCEPTDMFVSLIPKSILVCQYVHFRMTLRKFKIKAKEITYSQSQSHPAQEWSENIKDLWKIHLSHFQKNYDDNCLKLDCVTLQYVDGNDNETESEIWVDESMKTEEEVVQKTEDDPKPKRRVMENPSSDGIPSSVSPNNAASSTQSFLTGKPSDKAIKMTSEELCQWLEKECTDDKYVKCFRKSKINGKVMATLTNDDLKEMGIAEGYLRKKMLVQFREIS